MTVSGSTSGVSTRSSVIIFGINPTPVEVVVVIFGYLVIPMGVIPTPTIFPNSPRVGEKHCFVPFSFSTQTRSPGVYPIPGLSVVIFVMVTSLGTPGPPLPVGG